MPIIDTSVIDGPNIQADGQHRGTAQFIFSDGREFTRNIRAEDINAWTTLLADLPSEVELQVQKSDSEIGISDTDEISTYKEATIAQRAVAYLRKAYSTGDPYEAYRLLTRFNNYRTANGYTANQVKTVMLNNGMSEEEFDNIITAWQFLSSPGRDAVMLAYEEIREYWEQRP